MKEYLVSVISVSVLSCVITSVITEGKTSKTIIFLINLIVGLTVILPIVNYIKKEETFSFTVSGGYKAEENLNYDYINFSISNKVDFKRKVIINYIKSLNENGEVAFDYEIDEDYNVVYKKISVKLDKKVILNENENINISEEIKSYISSFLLVDKDIIVVYE